jgi:hypothetical protein
MTKQRGIPLELFLGDVVRLRKPHPCGGFDWTVVRLGADIGLRCLGCNRRVLLPRRELERRLKLFVFRGPDFEIAARDRADESTNGAPAVSAAPATSAAS